MSDVWEKWEPVAPSDLMDWKAQFRRRNKTDSRVQYANIRPGTYPADGPIPMELVYEGFD